MSSGGFGEIMASEITRSQSGLGRPNMHSGSESAMTYQQKPASITGDFFNSAADK